MLKASFCWHSWVACIIFHVSPKIMEVALKFIKIGGKMEDYFKCSVKCAQVRMLIVSFWEINRSWFSFWMLLTLKYFLCNCSVCIWFLDLPSNTFFFKTPVSEENHWVWGKRLILMMKTNYWCSKKSYDLIFNLKIFSQIIGSRYQICCLYIPLKECIQNHWNGVWKTAVTVSRRNVYLSFYKQIYSFI